MRIFMLFSSLFLLSLFGCADKEETVEQLIEDAEKHIEHGKLKEAKLLYDEILQMEIPADEKDDVEELKREIDNAEENTN